jgi:hypothetical protein
VEHISPIATCRDSDHGVAPFGLGLQFAAKAQGKKAVVIPDGVTQDVLTDIAA